jgi:hypothetical protein
MDTPQTRDDLVTALADNTTGAITAQTVRNLLASVPLTSDLATASVASAGFANGLTDISNAANYTVSGGLLNCNITGFAYGLTDPGTNTQYSFDSGTIGLHVDKSDNDGYGYSIANTYAQQSGSYSNMTVGTALALSPTTKPDNTGTPAGLTYTVDQLTAALQTLGIIQ